MPNIYHDIYNAIAKAEIITIFRHIKPDGDAYGAQMGLRELIMDNFPNKRVYVLGEQNNHWMKLMGPMDENVEDEIIKNSLAIVLDVANVARVDDLRFQKASEIIKIDHHIFVETFGQLELVEEKMMATCEILTKLAIENKLTISPEAATYLYCGLITDSGRFLYSNTTAQTMRYAATLIESGVDIIPLYDYIYEVDEPDVRFVGYCKLNYQRTPNGVAYMFITKEARSQFGIGENQGAGSVNALANIKDINIHVFFSEKDDGAIKIEFRSKKYPVNTIAAKYGGGGHILASGAIVANWDIAKQVLQDLDEECKELNNA